MPRADNSRFWIAAEAFLATSMVVLPASLGGAPEWTSWVLWACASGALVCWAIGARRNRRRWSRHPALLLPLALLVVTLLQLVPLPPTVLAFVSPRQAELREFSLVALGLEAWRPVAVDVPATLRACSRLVSLAALFFVALELGRVDGVRRRLFAVLALSAVTVASCGFVHLLAGADSLFGAYHFAAPLPLVTPFGNTNHLAAWLTLGGTVALGLALKTATRDAVIGWGVVALLCAAGVFFSFSRGGIGVFVGTWGLVGVSLLARRSGGMRGSLPWVFIVGTLLVAGFLSFEQLVERAETLSSLEKFKATKVDLWPSFAMGLSPYWLLGLGPGGFELGFAFAQTRELSTTFTHPEMVLFQWVADFGVPVTVSVLVVAAWLGWRLWSVTRPDETANVALIAVLGVVVHDVFDFALELNALAPAVCIVLGVLCSLDERVGRERVQVWSLPMVGIAGVAAAIALVVALPGYVAAEHSLRDAIVAKRPFPEVRARGLQLIDRHPADWVLYADIANDAARRADPHEALAWINRVLALRPADAGSHLAAASALLRLKQPMQALGEYKLAWQHGDWSSLASGLALAGRLDAWDRVVLSQPGHLEESYLTLRRAKKDDDARSLLEAARMFPPTPEVGVEAQLLSMRHEAELGSPGWALATIDQLAPSLQERADVVMTQAGALVKLERGDEAVRLLEKLLNREPTNLSAGLMLVDLHASQARPMVARDVLNRVRPFATSQAQRSALFQREAALWLQEERFPRAIDALQTASRIEPESASLHYQLAAVYERMGSLHSAADEVRRGRLLDSPEGARSREAWLNRLERAVGPLP